MIKQIGQAIVISDDMTHRNMVNMNPLWEASVDQLVDGLVRYLTEHHASMVDRPRLSITRGPDQNDPFNQHTIIQYRVTVDEP